MNRYLFLDIDGVLNCQIFYEKKGYPADITTYEQDNICLERVGWIKELCDDTDCKVIISSSWRHGNDLEYFNKHLPGLPIIGKTVSLHFHSLAGQEYNTPSVPRGCEIAHWLSNEVGDGKYQYAILDDDVDMLLEQSSHFFQTDPYAGLTPFHCWRIKQLFLES